MMQHPMVLFGKDEWLLMSNKECAYARYLPDEVVRSENCPVAAVPQAAAKRVNHRYYLDVLPEGAAAEDVYHKGDTHWHHLGALLAFNATMRAIGLPESEDGEFIRVDSYIDGDLSIKIGERIASVKLSPAALKHRLIDNNAVNNIGQRRIYENAD